MRHEDLAGRVHDAGSHTALDVISLLRLKAAVPARSSGTDPRPHVGQTVIRFADDAYITPGEARKLAAALVELAEYADGIR
jgi:hypothetical protein